MRLEFVTRWILVIVMAASICAPVAAQTWPARPVRIIAPFPPGGGTDTVGRLLAQKFAEQIGGSFVVENRPGAAGVLGAELVARAAPDGYTLLISAPEMSINPSMRSKVPYDALRDFAFISQLTSGQFMLASHPSVPARTVKQLIALAKTRPGQLNYATSGAGGINHLAGELLQSVAGFRWVHVPFKGAGPAVIAAIGGEVDFVIAATTGLVEHARAGKVRPIAVTGRKRFGELPEVPTLAEGGVPGYEVTGWYGFYAPAGISPEIVRRLHAEAKRGLNSPDVKEKLVRTGNEPVVSTPEEFATFVRAEIAKWAKVVKEANLGVE
jgi:tripartite-type tricarboxylate transporter receptor subunit TctC